MLKWENEMDAYGTAYWVNLAPNIELSLYKRNGIRKDAYVYSLKWGDSYALDCHWTENLTAENLPQAKAKAILRTRHIITSYIQELQEAMGELYNVDLDN